MKFHFEYILLKQLHSSFQLYSIAKPPALYYSHVIHWSLSCALPSSVVNIRVESLLPQKRLSLTTITKTISRPLLCMVVFSRHEMCVGCCPEISEIKVLVNMKIITLRAKLWNFYISILFDIMEKQSRLISPWV